MEFYAALHGVKWRAPKVSVELKGPGRSQTLGEYCKGEELSECRRLFGPELAKVCATCPN